MSGRILGFGGRTLLTDKKVAKYINSPESIIYPSRQEMKLDPTDRHILTVVCMGQDIRVSTITRETRYSSATVSRRLSRLKELGALRQRIVPVKNDFWNGNDGIPLLKYSYGERPFL